MSGFGWLICWLSLPFSILLRAFVMTQLWGWFVVPLGVVRIGLAHAYGLSVLVALFMPLPSRDDESVAFKIFFVGFVVPLVLWGFGFVCAFLM